MLRLGTWFSAIQDRKDILMSGRTFSLRLPYGSGRLLNSLIIFQIRSLWIRGEWLGRTKLIEDDYFGRGNKCTLRSWNFLCGASGSLLPKMISLILNLNPVPTIHISVNNGESTQCKRGSNSTRSQRCDSHSTRSEKPRTWVTIAQGWGLLIPRLHGSGMTHWLSRSGSTFWQKAITKYQVTVVWTSTSISSAFILVSRRA